ncbi:MAG: endonuclease/exonuclease/phosphatase family protein [Epsilonproteobacteria bacterium]|nr:MAG: endonuclease/exonuclease/phosphatase family protein [Campylobacterota bacterium]
MFKPSQLHHSSSHDHCPTFMPNTFGMLCWNVHKNNQKHPQFKTFLQKEVEKRVVDLILFQEANFYDNQHFELPLFSYNAAANLEFKGEFYGVLTASKTESTDAKAYLSEGRESIFGPHKSLLLSSYTFHDSSTLLVINVHAINFRENQRYSKELERFLGLVETYKGAMILAGDFNSWNNKRMEKLQNITKKLSLKEVNFKNTGKVKSFMGKKLDFIFYRELELVDSVVLEEHNLSDHNPLFVNFKRVRNNLVNADVAKGI